MISPRLLANAVDARLRQAAGLTVFYGDVIEPVELNPISKRIKQPYVVQWPTPGRPYDEAADLGDEAVDLHWTAHLTVAGPFVDDTLHALAAVHQLMFRWSPSLLGVVCGRFHPPDGYDPGPIRMDDKVTPPRFYAPLVYELTATIT